MSIRNKHLKKAFANIKSKVFKSKNMMSLTNIMLEAFVSFE